MTTYINNTTNRIDKITEVYVFVSVDEGGEGIIGRNTTVLGQEMFLPFVCADKAMLEYLKPMAKEITTMTDKKVRLIRLSVREVLEEYENNSNH